MVPWANNRRCYIDKPGGYAGNILYVNLSDKSITTRPLPKELILNFLGGQGINTRLAYELIRPGEAPLSPGNPLVFGSGPFVGTIIPGAAKSNIAGKSPTSGLLGISGSGHFGMLKFSGYDHLVVTGRADRPVYLKICNDSVEIRDAAHLWGKDVWEATEAIWRELGDEYVVACIGPAGENLVRDASIITNKYSAFARTGLGSVMGSKNFKAIAVYGTRDITVAHPERFTELVDKLYSEFMAHPNLKNWRLYGTLISLEPMARSWLYANRNFQGAAGGDELLKIFDTQNFLQKIKGGDVACMACPVGCKHYLQLKEGEHAGLIFSISCVNAAVQAFGAFCEVKGWEEILKCAELCNRLGLDYFYSGALIAFAMELYQRGIIDRKDTDGLELVWGRAEVTQDLINKIAHREGFGHTLADGLIEASKRIGGNSEDYIIQLKGLGWALDPRIRFSTDIFSQFVNARGDASHIGITMLRRTRDQLKRYCQRIRVPEDVLDVVLAGREGFNPARLAKWAEDYTMVLECLGLCQFPLFQRFDIDVWVNLYSALTGIETGSAGLLRAAERGWDVKKAFNTREGASKKDDLAPKRFTTEPVKVGERMHDFVDEKYLSKLVTEYYQERGWNPDDGKVSKERLKELGL